MPEISLEFCAQVTHGKENSQVSGCLSLKTMALHPFLPSPRPFSSSSLPVGRHVHDRPSRSSPLLPSFPLHHRRPSPLSGLPFTDPYPGGLTVPGKPQKSERRGQRNIRMRKRNLCPSPLPDKRQMLRQTGRVVRQSLESSHLPFTLLSLDPHEFTALKPHQARNQVWPTSRRCCPPPPSPSSSQPNHQ